MSSDPSRPPAAPMDTRFLLIIGALLLMTIVALAALWLRERNARIAAEKYATDIRQQYETEKFMLAKGLEQVARSQGLNGGEGGVAPIGAGEFEVGQQVQVGGGENRTAIEVPLSVARRVGPFNLRTVMVVVPDSETKPTTRPRTEATPTGPGFRP